VFVLLTVSSLLARRLVARADPADPDRVAMLANLQDRIGAWWVMIAILAVAFVAGRNATFVLFALVSFWCLREFLSLTPNPVGDHYAIASAFYLFLPLQYLLLWDAWLGVFTIAIPVYAFLLLPVLAALHGDTRDFLARVAKVQWALMLAVYCVSHAPALLILGLPGQPAAGVGLLAFLLVVTEGSDVLQYGFGKRFGRRRIAPDVSPNKTWEGFVLGGLAATLAGGALFSLTPFGIAGASAMALAIVLAGFAGGLVLSAVKRSLGAKDWGTMVEGHGGMLDRMDSLAFAAPLFFHLSNYFWVP
jgi:phosphatidate cytidylyltransferase